MDHQHGAQPFPAGQRPELERRDVAGARGQAMLARLGKQAGGASDRGFDSRSPSLPGLDVLQKSSKAARPGKAGAMCSPAPNSVLMTL